MEAVGCVDSVEFVPERVCRSGGRLFAVFPAANAAAAAAVDRRCCWQPLSSPVSIVSIRSQSLRLGSPNVLNAPLCKASPPEPPVPAAGLPASGSAGLSGGAACSMAAISARFFLSAMSSAVSACLLRRAALMPISRRMRVSLRRPIAEAICRAVSPF